MDKKESNSAKFKRIANIRTNNVLRALRSLAKLSNSRSYDFNKTDINKIFTAITNDVRIARAMFDKNLKDNQFKLWIYLLCVL